MKNEVDDEEELLDGSGHNTVGHALQQAAVSSKEQLAVRKMKALKGKLNERHVYEA
jgi:hypothetical protein